jgi:GrpB-like predicted nucleotidyltransferase (UPF0157 family)
MKDIKIEILPYDKKWAEMFHKESQSISIVLRNNCKAIYHVGSTSIPMFSSKPIIDMAAEVDSILAIDQYNKSMSALGYEAKGEYGIPFRRYFRKRKQFLRYNLHIFEVGSPEIEKFLLFRDYLCFSPLERDAYLALKRRSAEIHQNNILAYSLVKNQFIQLILKKSGFSKFCLLHPSSFEDHTNFKYITQKACFEIAHPFYYIKEVYDIKRVYKQFILNKGVETVGALHLDFLKENSTLLKLLSIDKTNRNQGYGTYFLDLINKWLFYKHQATLYTYSPEKSLKFFQNYGFFCMDFKKKSYEDLLLEGLVSLGKSLGSEYKLNI